MKLQDKEQTEDLVHARTLVHNCWFTFPELLLIDRLVSTINPTRSCEVMATSLDAERPFADRLSLDLLSFQTKVMKYVIAASARCAWEPLQEYVERYNYQIISELVPNNENPDEYDIADLLLQKDSEET